MLKQKNQLDLRVHVKSGNKFSQQLLTQENRVIREKKSRNMLTNWYFHHTNKWQQTQSRALKMALKKKRFD